MVISDLNLFIQIEKIGDDLELADEMNKEIIKFYNKVIEFIEWNSSFIENDIQSMTVEELGKSIEYEKEIDNIRNKLIDSSRERLSKGSKPKIELLFIDIIKHLEHIGDYSLNISQALEEMAVLEID